MLTICILDDEKNSREVLQLLIKENHPDINIAGMAPNIKEGILLIEQKRPDIIFLDIEMPGGNGFQLVKQLEEPVPEIIFCTAYDQYAIKAIECSAIAYLLKPVSPKKLADAIGKAKIKTPALQHNLQMNILEEQLNPEKTPTRFIINTAEDIKIIKFDEVVCCIAESNYTKVHLADGGKIVASKTLKEFENILHQPNFFRIHHSYLINMNFIKRISKADGCMVELSNGINLDVAKTRKADLLGNISKM